MATKQTAVEPNGPNGKTIIDQIAEKRSAFPLKEFAELVSIDYNTAYDLYRRGLLPGAMRVGGSIRLDPKTIAQWLRDSTMVAVQ